MDTAKVLICDDSRTSRKLLREILETGGFTVIGEATNGEEGWLQYKELKPDLVTMDITMPKMDGVESLSLIMRDDPDAKVVMLSASGQREKMVEAIRRGARDFISKPFEPDKVTGTLWEVVRGN